MGCGCTGFLALLLVGRISGDQDMARLQNGRTGKAMAVVFVKRKASSRVAEGTSTSRSITMRTSASSSVSLRPSASFSCSGTMPASLARCKEARARPAPRGGKQRRAGIVRRMVLRLRQNVGFVDRHAIDGHRIEDRARLRWHARIRLLIGRVARIMGMSMLMRLFRWLFPVKSVTMSLTPQEYAYARAEPYGCAHARPDSPDARCSAPAHSAYAQDA